MTITADLTGVEAWRGGGGLPNGWHLCRIESADDSEPSSGGHQQLVIEWCAIEGESQGLGKTEWLVITPAAYGKFKAFLEAVGIDTSGPIRLEPGELRGRAAFVFVGEEPDHRDATRSVRRVKAHRPAPSTGAAASSSVMARHDDIPF